MDNYLSGSLGVLIGIVLTSVISFFLFKKQSRIESNRIFLQDMLQVIQRIYLSLLQGKFIDEKDINYLISFQAIGLRDFKDFNSKLSEVRTNLISYNDGVQKTIESTSTSTLQISAKTLAETKLHELIEILRELT